MHLIIDSGNTCTKVAVFNVNNAIVVQYRWESASTLLYDELLKNYQIQAAIVCAVVAVDATILDFLKQRIPYVLVLDHNTPVPLQNAYKTPQTLGLDRLAVAVGAAAQYPHTPLLIIDAGTAITYEFVSSDNQYMGGNIAPGAVMRLQAMHHFTQKLPLLSLADVDETIMGNDTASAMLKGVINGMVYEMEGYIAALKEKYPQLLIFLTGGDAFFFERRLKSSIFVTPNLLLFGLNQILSYNTCQ